MTHRKTTKFESGMFTADGFDHFGQGSMVDHFIIDWGVEIQFNKSDIDFYIFVDKIAFIGENDAGDFEDSFKPAGVKISKVTTDVSIDIQLIEVDFTDKSIELVL